MSTQPAAHDVPTRTIANNAQKEEKAALDAQERVSQNLALLRATHTRVRARKHRNNKSLQPSFHIRSGGWGMEQGVGMEELKKQKKT